MKRFLYIILILLLASPVWAVDYYINPDCTHDGNGTFNTGSCAAGAGQAGPYNTWTGKISAGNDYRQKCGTSWDSGTQLEITAQGTSENYILIGAYYDDGGVVHEDDNPSVGLVCGNSDAKPIITATTKKSGNAIKVTGTFTSHYIEFNSISARKGYGAIRLYHTDNNKVRYCYLYDSFWGVYLEYSDNSVIEYNTIDLNNTGGDENADTDDAIGIRGESNTIRFNKCTGYDHVGITIEGGLTVSRYNVISSNYMYNTTDTEDAGFGCSTSSYNTFSYNYCNDVGVAFQIAGKHNVVKYNVAYVDFDSNYDNFAFFNVNSCCHTGCIGYAAASDNVIMGNTVYQGNSGTGVNNWGFGIYEGADETLCNEGDINENNYYINNILYKTKADQECIIVTDVQGDLVGTNYFWNNQCYGYEANKYADIKGTPYATATAFNARGDATGNQEGDPKLEDVANKKFWLDSTSPCIDNGYTGAHDDGLNQTTTWSPISIATLDQDDFGTKWEIGAYVYGFFITDISPADESTGVSITTDLNWTNPTETTSIDLLFDKDTTPPTTKELDDQNVETWDCETLDPDSDYYWRVDVNHAGGTETGTVYKFTTAGGPPAQTSGFSGRKYHKTGGEIKH